METRNLICIGCPLGCPVTVTMDGDDINVTGNTCPRGADYAKKEVLSPTRIVTSSIRVKDGAIAECRLRLKAIFPNQRSLR